MSETSQYQRMLHLRQVHRGKYQNAEDYIKPDGSYRTRTLTLDWVDLQDFDRDDGGTETKPVLHFQPTRSGIQPLPMSVCKESWQAIAGMISPIRGELINNSDSNGPSWKGFRITFTAEVFKETKLGPMEGIRPIGSPDLERDVEVTIQLYTKIKGRVQKRKPFKRRMVRTGNGAAPPTSRSKT
jgi:hypothetical protein